MITVIRREHSFLEKALRENTYQEEFPKQVKCHKCKKDATPLMLIMDDDQFICSQDVALSKGQFWPHDAMAIALYLCLDSSCGKITALWNQA